MHLCCVPETLHRTIQLLFHLNPPRTHFPEEEGEVEKESSHNTGGTTCPGIQVAQLAQDPQLVGKESGWSGLTPFMSFTQCHTASRRSGSLILFAFTLQTSPWAPTCSAGPDLGQSVLGWWGRGGVPRGARGKLSRWHSSPSLALSFPALVACPPSLSYLHCVSHLPQAMLPSSTPKHS